MSEDIVTKVTFHQLITPLKESNFTLDKEKVLAYKRQVTSGGHKRKLKPESIEILNSEFGEFLDLLGYQR